VTSVAFDDPLRTRTVAGERRIQLSEQDITINGAATLRNQLVASAELQEVTISPAVTVGTLKVKSVTGLFDPEIDDVHESVYLDLGDDLDFLKEDGNTLKLTDPQIALNLTSTVSVPVLLDMSVSSKRTDGTYIVKDIVPDDGTITLPASEPGKSRDYSLIIYQKERTLPTASPDSIFVRISEFDKLLETIPDSICFDLEAYADTTVEGDSYHMVDITSDLKLSGAYDVTIPLQFDELHVEYNDSIKDLQGELDDITDYLEDAKMSVTAQVTNTIPLEIVVTLTPYDLNGKTLEGITVEPVTVAAGTLENPVTFDLKLAASISGEALSKLDGFALKASCTATQTVGGSSLNSGQYIQVQNVAVCIGNGININLDDDEE